MGFISQDIENYCVDHSSKPSQVAKDLMNFTRESVHGSNMLIGEMEGAVLKFLIQLGKVKKVVELGTYTGYSALTMAEALPEDGKVITIDLNPETTKLAQSYWDKSPHGKKIQSILAPGLDALKTLNDKYDLVFIDADKNNYPNYLKWALEHLSPNGLIVTDNTLWSGKVLEAGVDKQTDSIREHNDFAKNLEGYSKVLLPIRDGMFLIQKGL